MIGPILSDSPTRHALETAGSELGMRPIIDAREGAPRVRFEGSWDAYWAARSSSLRADVRRVAEAVAVGVAVHVAIGMDATGRGGLGVLSAEC